MKPEMKKLIIANLPYLLFVYLFDKLGQTYRLAAGADLSEKLLHLADGFSLAFESAAPSFHLFDLAVGVVGAVTLRLMVYCKSKNAKKYRRGVEYGSARWGGPKDIAPYIDPVFDNNILLTQTERLTMNNRPKDPKTARNKNVLVIGGSGSGKTRFFVKPNLMQCVSKDYPTSFVITDPKGSLIGEVGQLLVRCGYRVKVLNTINFSKSMRYNPFRYIHSEKDILKLVNTLICNTKGEGEKSAEDFWIKSERLLYSALICFGGALLVGVPLFFLIRGRVPTSAAALIMVFAMLPGFLLALYEKHGQPLEVVVRQIVECCFIQPKERPYQTNNAYTALVRQSQMEKEVNAIVQKAKERNERKSAGQAHPRRKERDSGRHPKV